MNYRKLKQEEIDLSFDMSSYAFQYALSDEEREERREWVYPENTWVAEENGEILSKATTIPFNVFYHGQSIAMGGVSGVATWPEQRRSGLVKNLLAHSLQEMKEKGQIVSFLFPFSIPFYRKYGWELFADTQTITLTREQLPKRKETNGYVRRIKPSIDVLQPVYDAWAKLYNGTIDRHEDWWKRSVFKRKKGNVAVYYNGDSEAKGYMIYEVKEEKMTIKELISLTPESRDGLWTFIANHDSMIKSVVLKTTPHDGMPFLLDDPKVSREVTSYFMARIVDVKSFLSYVPFKQTDDEKPLIFHVTDEFCEWNHGTFVIGPKESNIQFFPFKKEGSCTHEPKRGCRLSIQTLSALLFGSQRPDMLIREGLIEGEEHELNRLIGSIPYQPAFIYDFF
ncbi:GNAT family N-acetyltransferase [Bacillus shivajii]|uniref:GNAT family N-acetyltransferase n=1 Tax=Bacillus shivajii TaxID=1983719 RepID=UPI001CFC41CE|nr:GNAT family N-acetyltransferase [Bacillus shivajii]UCZ54039.1 GNAT family N-acetyltransferase [Bacillus shivajii]